jgi:hypothetical protein
MAGNSNSGGPRKNAGRKSNARKLLDAGFAAVWFTHSLQETKWIEFIESEDEKIRLEAMKYITDRLYGKATQVLASDPTSPIGITIVSSIPRPERK